MFTDEMLARQAESEQRRPIEEDCLWRLLKSGMATRAEQKDAADWIAWMYQHVPPIERAKRRLGIYGKVAG